MAALHASQGGHRTTLVCKKLHIYICKYIYIYIYVKLTYCDNPNKNVEYLDLRITKKLGSTKIRIMLHSQHFHNNFITNPMW